MSDLLLKNGAVLDCAKGELKAGLDLVISQGKIAAIGKGLQQAGACRIDLGGRTVMPGLIDCHVHVMADAMVAYPTIFPSLATARAAKLLNEALLRGFTTLRDAGGADAGHRQAIEKGLFPGPRLFVSGRPISQTGGHGDVRHPADFCPVCQARQESNLLVVADGVDEVRKAVREEIRRGADQIKIMASGGISSPSDPIDYDQYSMAELEAAVDEATRAKRYVAAHAYTASAISRAVVAGVRTIEHGNFLNEEAAQLMAERGAFLVPTLIVYRRVVEMGASLGLPAWHLEKAHEVLATGTRSLEIARRAGVKIAFGTDLFRAPKEHQCEEFLVRAEIEKPADILLSATLVGAEVVGQAHRLGQVAEGYVADLLVVDGNPLEDLGLLQGQGRHLSMILKEGALVKDSLSPA